MSIHFVGIHCSAAENRQKISLKAPILRFKVIDVNIAKKQVTSGCYDK